MYQIYFIHYNYIISTQLNCNYLIMYFINQHQKFIYYLNMELFRKHQVAHQHNNKHEWGSLFEIFNFLEKETTLHMRYKNQGQINKSSEVFHSLISERLHNIRLEIMLQDKKIKKSNGHDEAIKLRIKRLYQQIFRMKQLYLYSYVLKSRENSLDIDIMKFLQYAPTSTLNFQEQIQSYLQEPIIFQFLFSQHSKTYNINIFITDLIDFLIFKTKSQQKQHKKKQLENTQDNVRITEIKLLTKENISFKQLSDLNEKYSKLSDSLKASYINLNYIQEKLNLEIKNKHSLSQEKAYQLQKNINIKYKNIEDLLNKLKKIKVEGQEYAYHSSFGQLQQLSGSLDKRSIRISPEDQNVFQNFKENYPEFTSFKTSQQFQSFISELFEINSQKNDYVFKRQKQTETPKLYDFQFLRKRIIKVQILHNLNRTLSAFNLCSHFMNLIQLSPSYAQYTFKPLSTLINSQFNDQMFQKINNNGEYKCLDSYNVQFDGMGGWLIQNNKQILIYPSAIHRFIVYLKYLIFIGGKLQRKKLYFQEVMLSIMIAKADQCCRWGEIFQNIYSIIRLKQVQCYGLFSKFIHLIAMGDLIPDNKALQDASTVDQILLLYKNQTKKADYISQIIYELDQKYSIAQILKKMIQIQQKNIHTFYYGYNISLYEFILNQIIKTRNNLKLDHQCYSLTQIHDIFSFFTNKIQSFEDLIRQLSKISSTSFAVEPLIRFFHCQLKLKRSIFKGQFYWNLIYDDPQIKRQDNPENNSDKFKEFIQTNLRAFKSFSNNTIGHFINHIEQFQRASSFFQNQIQRLILVYQISSLLKIEEKNKIKDLNQSYKIQRFSNYEDQSIINISKLGAQINEYFPNIKQQLLKMNYNNLKLLLRTLKPYNIIEEIVLDTSSHRAKLIRKVLNILQNQSHITMQTLLQQYSSILYLRALLSDLIWFKYMIPLSISPRDCLILLQKMEFNNKNADELMKLQIVREMKQIKIDYQQFLNEEDPEKLKQGIKFYYYLIVSGLIAVLQREDLPKSDKRIIIKMLKSFSVYDIINEIEELSKQGKKLSQYSESSDQYKSGQINLNLKIMALFKYLNQCIENRNFQQQKPKIIEKLYLLTEIEPMSCQRMNQCIQNVHRQLKHNYQNLKSHTPTHSFLSPIKILKDSVLNRKKQIEQKQQKLSFMNKSIEILKKRVKNHFWNEIKKIKVHLASFNSMDETYKHLKQKNKMIIEKSFSSTPTASAFRQNAKGTEQLYYGKKQIIICEQLRGYEIKQDTPQQIQFWQRQFKNKMEKVNRNITRRQIKKPFFALAIEVHDFQLFNRINKKVKVAIILDTLSIRKHISRLQLQNKFMRDQIVWETFKQGHSVLSKINQFIAQSNKDQQQSYNNFKYTVNLQTIKGMQNVIEQQTEMYLENREYKDGNSKIRNKIGKDGPFLTEVELQGDQQKNRLLQVNVDCIVNHLQKIRIFAAWKNTMKNTDLTQTEYQKFNYNVNRILHDEKSLKKIKDIHEVRGKQLREKTIYCLIKQENQILNQKIQDLKLKDLQKKVINYKIREQKK